MKILCSLQGIFCPTKTTSCASGSEKKDFSDQSKNHPKVLF